MSSAKFIEGFVAAAIVLVLFSVTFFKPTPTAIQAEAAPNTSRFEIISAENCDNFRIKIIRNKITSDTYTIFQSFRDADIFQVLKGENK